MKSINVHFILNINFSDFSSFYVAYLGHWEENAPPVFHNFMKKWTVFFEVISSKMWNLCVGNGSM
jgi:hypothetical protein